MKPTKKKKQSKISRHRVNGSDCLSENVRVAMEKYFKDLDGHEPVDLYKLILSQIEAPLFESVLDYTDGNVTRAADILGLNRGTLRNRLRIYDIE
jgi:Fis family transcriptional regulator, factor for inversion stimulation protein